MTTDPIADLINQIKNAGAVKKSSVSVPFSNFKLAIAEKLKELENPDSGRYVTH